MRIIHRTTILPTPHQKKQTMTVRINVNGNEIEIIAKADPHSFYTILNVPLEEGLLGEDIKIALKDGKKKANGRIVTGSIYVNDQATAGQIVYVRTFPKTIIGWKQLHELGLIQANTHRGFVMDVPPVLIEGDTDPYNFSQGDLRPYLIADASRVIASWVRKGLIERCNSVCNAPISLTMKGNRKVKIIFDFEDLNKCSTKEPSHPKVHRPRAIEDITLGNYYSVFKLFYAEWQIPLDTYTKYKTAFTFLDKQYVWNRLPGSFQNTTNRLSDALEKVLSQLPQNIRKRVTYYTDTILISAETKEECEKFTDKLWRHLVDNSFEISQTRCQKSEPVVQFLGREITQDGIRLGKDFIWKVKNSKLPRNTHHLRSILGFLDDANQYTPGYGIFSKRLNELTREKCEFVWNGKYEATLVHLKNQILVNGFVVSGLAEREACMVQIFVNDGAWMAQILNSAKKPYRFGSGVLEPLKSKDVFATQELKAMKEVWKRHEFVLESRDVEWEVESPEIARYKDEPESVTIGKRLNLDFLKRPRCKIKVVPASGRKPPIPWPQNL
ncbi:uncharacterized protein LOC142657714 [Rhinoderma darwinii]|uniref:uncharacterized protein LOC142657714 n=1 Tax=Rhinoderma darwinii TaxID=43563 RepID=UPI003F6659D2